MAVDISALSFDELTLLEKEIKKKKDEMHNNREAFYKTIAFQKLGIYELSHERFPLSLYPDAKVIHYDDGDFVALGTDLYFRLEKAVLTICDATIGNYKTKNDKLIFGGAVITKHPKEYLSLCADLCEVIKKYDKMIFKNGVEIDGTFNESSYGDQSACN